MTAQDIVLLVVIIIAAVGIIGFIFVDAYYAFDDDPDTHTASERIKSWRRESNGSRSFLITLAIYLLGFVIVYLFGHLVLELW